MMKTFTGVLGLVPSEWRKLTFNELFAILIGRNQKDVAVYRQDMEKRRWQAFMHLTPHLPEGTKITDIWQFDWEKSLVIPSTKERFNFWREKYHLK